MWPTWCACSLISKTSQTVMRNGKRLNRSWYRKCLTGSIIKPPKLLITFFPFGRLCNEIFILYSELDHETKPKNIAAWTPVVVSILTGLTNLQDQDVSDIIKPRCRSIDSSFPLFLLDSSSDIFPSFTNHLSICWRRITWYLKFEWCYERYSFVWAKITTSLRKVYNQQKEHANLR